MAPNRTDEKLKTPLSQSAVQGMGSLYAWQPKGHGEYSFFVAASSKAEAIKAIEKYIEEHMDKDDDHYLDEYNIKGWGTDYYDLTILPIGEAITNSND